MQRIGLLSDTHGYLNGDFLPYLADCDQIWHAGDIGSAWLADTLEGLKKMHAVYGNIDGENLRRRYKEAVHFSCQGLSIYMTHITGRPPHYTPRIREKIRKNPPDILVGGHSHILGVIRDKNGMLFLNPGAAGRSGIHKKATMLRFVLAQKKIKKMEVIELPK